MLKNKWNILKLKIITGITGIVALLGGYIIQLRTCAQNTVVASTHIVQNPSNQIVVIESASFVANLFYDGPDDPFATSGAGGELGKLTHVVLRKGQKLFGETITKIIGKTDDIIKTSRSWASPQIQEGQRAIQKKVGHASANNYVSAFENIKFTQKNAEKIINEIVIKADVVVIRPYLTKIYNSKGQGVSIETKTAKFVGLVERSLEKEL